MSRSQILGRWPSLLKDPLHQHLRRDLHAKRKDHSRRGQTNGLELGREEIRTINWAVGHLILYTDIVFAQHKGMIYLVVW